MSAYNVINPAGLVSGQPEDISVVLANFQAVAAVLNGHIDDANIVAGAAIALSKLANAGTIGAGAVAVTATGLTLGGDVSLARTAPGVLVVTGHLVTQRLSPVQIAPPQLTGNVNDYSPAGLSTAGSIRLTTNGAYNISGIDGTQSGQWLVLLNESTFTLNLLHNDAGSAGVNRFALPGSVTYPLLSGKSVMLVYNNSNFKWTVIG